MPNYIIYKANGSSPVKELTSFYTPNKSYADTLFKNRCQDPANSFSHLWMEEISYDGKNKCMVANRPIIASSINPKDNTSVSYNISNDQDDHIPHTITQNYKSITLTINNNDNHDNHDAIFPYLIK